MSHPNTHIYTNFIIMISKNASILHFILPAIGLTHLKGLDGLPSLPWFVRALCVASHSYNLFDARSKTKHLASFISFQTLLLCCFHMLHKIQANSAESPIDNTCRIWKMVPLQPNPWFLAHNGIDSWGYHIHIPNITTGLICKEEMNVILIIWITEHTN